MTFLRGRWALNENNIKMAKITNLSPPARETEGVARGWERGEDDGIGTRFLARLTHFGNVGWQIVPSSCALRHQKTNLSRPRLGLIGTRAYDYEKAIVLAACE
jgi:hypothetical protein